MGCTCTKTQFCLSDTMYVFEKIASCCALSAVVVCIIATLIFVLSVGVGIGYNYCFVDLKIHKADGANDDRASLRTADDSSSDLKSNQPVLDNLDTRRSAADSLPIFVAPLHDNEYILTLLSKLRSQNKNATLQLQVI